MKQLLCCLILSSLLAVSCATYDGPFYIGMPYGTPGSPHSLTGKDRHPGIDFFIPRGTPIIAASDGRVVYIGTSTGVFGGSNGISVYVWHEKEFGCYMHLDQHFVEKGQSIKRGQLIGLSGTCDSGKQHLTFSVCKDPRTCRDYSQTYNPETLWLGGKAQCFDPKADYSVYLNKDLTLPIACGGYATELISKTKTKE